MAKDIIFVGDTQSTINCLIQKMKPRSIHTDYMERIISFFSGESNLQHYPVFLYEDFPYDFSCVELPQCHIGYVYFLVSLANSRINYIGETFDMITRLKQNNSGNGTTFTIENRNWSSLVSIATKIG